MQNQQSAASQLESDLQELCERHLPSKHPFFNTVAGIPRERLSPELLGELYVRYQAAMHSTRAMVYHLPHLDAPAMRTRKLQIFIDDDGLKGGDTHHYQLRRAFENIGAQIPLSDNEFGDLPPLAERLDPTTARFVSKVEKLYPQSLGPFCVVEMLSNDWMTHLCDALSVHFPQMRDEPYFAECAEQHVEERHGQEAFELAKAVVEHSPELLPGVVQDASDMANELDNLWTGLEQLLRQPAAPLKASA